MAEGLLQQMAGVRFGCVTSLQTCGAYGANFNPHAHALISDGLFTRTG
jgi:hypothetical protein